MNESMDKTERKTDRQFLTQFDRFLERLEKITGVVLRTQKDIGEMCGVSGGTVSYSKSRGTVPAGWLKHLRTQHGLNPDWLITGKGRPYLPAALGQPEAAPEAPEAPQAPVIPEALSAQTEQPGPAGSSTTGYVVMSGETDPFDAPAAGMVTIPAQVCQEGGITVRVDNDSMAPEVRSGAYVRVNAESKAFADGDICCLHMPHYGLMLRRVYLTPDGFRLVSGNKDFPDAEVSSQRMRQLLIGRVSWMMQGM